MTRLKGLRDIIGNHQHENEPVMKAGREKTKCQLDIAGKSSFKASVHVQVKGIKDESPAQEQLIMDGKGEKSCLLDGGKDSVHVKLRGDSWRMESSEESQHYTISS